VAGLRTFHELIDKGKLTQALKPLEKVRGLRMFQEFIEQKLRQEPGSLKIFKDVLSDILRLNSLQGEEELSNQIHFLLPHLWEKKDSPVIQEILLHAAFWVAWHEKGEVSLKEKMVRSLGKQIPSETLWEGLVATEEFYRITLEEVLSSAGLDTEKISLLKKHRRLLKAELERIKGEPVNETWVEFIPSKSQADRYFGYVAEDCNKTRGAVVDKKDFQIYRMITDGRLSGVIYLQRAKLEDMKVLVLALQPRPFWSVDHSALLKAVEEHLGRIAVEEGYEAVLLMQSKHQQSNRQDMLEAIFKRKYEKLKTQNLIDGTLFHGNEFLLMWKDNPAPKAPSRLLRMIRDRLPLRRPSN
jgi:hypothetical protein